MISCLKPSIALQMAHCIWGYCSIKQTLLATFPTLESFRMCALVSEVKRLPIFHIIPNFLHTPACVRCTWGETQREREGERTTVDVASASHKWLGNWLHMTRPHTTPAGTANGQKTKHHTETGREKERNVGKKLQTNATCDEKLQQILTATTKTAATAAMTIANSNGIDNNNTHNGWHYL